MNKLEEYRDKICLDISFVNNFAKQGFDAAIALDLPVKFAIWMTKPYPQEAKNIVRKHHPNYHKELYQYWLNNVYKPE